MTNIISLYVNIGEYEIFSKRPSYSGNTIKNPFGYYFTENKWSYVYKADTKNIVGKIITNNNYHNILNSVNGGYCNNNNVIFIENEFNKGSLEFVYNFYSNTNTTNINDNTVEYPTFCSGTDYYYNKKIESSFANYNNILYIEIYILDELSLYPSLSITQNVNVYWKGNEIQTFQSISGIYDSTGYIPFGINFSNLRWGYLFNFSTNNKIGYFITYNTYQNIDNKKPPGYCKDSVVIIINKELPIGTLGHTYSFLNPAANTNYIRGSKFNVTISCLTGEYYGKNIISSVYVDPFLTRFNYFTIFG